MNKEKWTPKEDETIWRVSDVIASGTSEAIYKTSFWKPIHNGFNCFRTKEDAEKARDEILRILGKEEGGE